jgi:polyhydroxybutyrate depolymerase
VLFTVVAGCSGTSDSGDAGSDSGTSDSGAPQYSYFAGDHALTLSHDGVERHYFVHVPPSYDGTQSTAVIINLHGGGGSAETAKAGSLMDASSDADGYIVVYPEALEGTGGGRKWNNGPRDDEADQGLGDDVGFIRAMLDVLDEDFAIDAARVFTTGISNGGMMAYRLACELSDSIAAAAPIASQRMVDSCTPDRPISVVHFHGLEDGLIPYEGGASDLTHLDGQVGIICYNLLQNHVALQDDMMSADESISAFLTRNDCPADSTTAAHGEQAQTHSYGPCENDSEVVVCTMADAGHTWPGGAYEVDGDCLLAAVGGISQDINANEMMWEFFQRHPLTE